MRLHRIVPVIVAVACLGWAPPALAGRTKTYAPPGKAGSSEYSEVIPASGGNIAPPSSGGGNTTPAQISAIGSGKLGVQKLDKLGKSGAAAAQFAQATAPVASTHGFGSTTSATRQTTAPDRRVSVLATPAGGSGLSAVGHLLAGSDANGIGVFLPLLLAFGLGAAVAVSVTRMRRGRRPPAA